jgi:tetratricopeptide (TPR) repeat protein
MSYYGDKKFALASQTLTPLAKAQPENTELQQIVAQSCLWAKNYACALELFRQLVQRNPDSAEAHILTGEALDGLGRTQEAIPEFEAAAKISSQQPNVLFGLGYLYWKSQQYDRARQEFEKQLTLEPKNGQALAYLGDIDWKDDHPDAALALLNRAAKIDPNLRIAQVDLGAIYLQQKNYGMAKAALLRAVTLAPSLPDVHYQLGRLYRALGENAAATKELQQAQELHQQLDESLIGKMSHTAAAEDSSNKEEKQ